MNHVYGSPHKDRSKKMYVFSWNGTVVCYHFSDQNSVESNKSSCLFMMNYGQHDSLLNLIADISLST